MEKEWSSGKMEDLSSRGSWFRPRLMISAHLKKNTFVRLEYFNKNQMQYN